MLRILMASSGERLLSPFLVGQIKIALLKLLFQLKFAPESGVCMDGPMTLGFLGPT